MKISSFPKRINGVDSYVFSFHGVHKDLKLEGNKNIKLIMKLMSTYIDEILIQKCDHSLVNRYVSPLF